MLYQNLFIVVWCTLFTMSCAQRSLDQYSLFKQSFGDPEETACDYQKTGDKKLYSGALTVDTEWKECVRIAGIVKVLDGVTLSIAPGTIVLASPVITFLVVEKGGMIQANGDSVTPIIFTSGKKVGERTEGDWGGVVINGAAPINIGDDSTGSNIVTDAVLGDFGDVPAIADHSNGTFSFVRIEFGGRPITFEADPSPSLQLRSVGTGTTIGDVHVTQGSGVGLMVQGGTATLSRAIATYHQTSQMVIQDGYVGTMEDIFLSTDTTAHALTMINNTEDIAKTPATHATINRMTVLGSLTLADAIDVAGEEEKTIGLDLKDGVTLALDAFRIGDYNLCFQGETNVTITFVTEFTYAFCFVISNGFTSSLAPIRGRGDPNHPLLIQDIGAQDLKTTVDADASLAYLTWTSYPEN